MTSNHSYTKITLIEYITPGKRCLFSGERQSYGLEKFIKRLSKEKKQTLILCPELLAQSFIGSVKIIVQPK